jgi:biotin operon repressor
MKHILNVGEKLTVYAGMIVAIGKDAVAKIVKNVVRRRESLNSITGNNASEIILQALKEENVSQTELAEMLGVSRQSVNSRINANMRCGSFFAMAEVLGYEIHMIKKNTQVRK